MSQPLSWVEISASAVVKNMSLIRQLIGVDRQLLMNVKANAYGHGLIPMATILEQKTSTDLLGVNALFEAEELRKAGIGLPILILGHTLLTDLESAIQQGFHLILSSVEVLEELDRISTRLEQKAYLHLKLETGLNRQGIIEKDLSFFLEKIQNSPYLELTGMYTHFADIEDSSDRQYADQQLESFWWMIRESGAKPRYLHIANSAATLLYPDTYLDLVRVGIAGYGLWPSVETRTSAETRYPDCALSPALTWKTQIAQVKSVPKNSVIGYGCSWQADRDMRIAIIPVGYYDGYDRKLSNSGSVLIRGVRAPIVGRICMNMCMVDVTEISNVQLEDEVVLLGKQNNNEITANEIAAIIGTINYEVVTRINERLERKIVD